MAKKPTDVIINDDPADVLVDDTFPIAEELSTATTDDAYQQPFAEDLNHDGVIEPDEKGIEIGTDTPQAMTEAALGDRGARTLEAEKVVENGPYKGIAIKDSRRDTVAYLIAASAWEGIVGYDAYPVVAKPQAWLKSAMKAWTKVTLDNPGVVFALTKTEALAGSYAGRKEFVAVVKEYLIPAAIYELLGVDTP